VLPVNIGIISPYRAQLKYINFLIQQYKGKHLESVEVQTVDQYQGRDKECIILSLVRANDSSNVGCLLRDWKRINVAFTRAKRKMIIFCNQKTLSSYVGFDHLLNFADARGWIYPLPPYAHTLYNIHIPTNSPPESPMSQVKTTPLSPPLFSSEWTQQKLYT